MPVPFSQTRVVTIREVYEAAAQHSYNLAHNDWFRLRRGAPTKCIDAACVLTQAAINLGVDERGLYRALNWLPGRVGNQITVYNDESADRKFKTVINRFRTLLEPHFDKTVRLPLKNWASQYDITSARRT